MCFAKLIQQGCPVEPYHSHILPRLVQELGSLRVWGGERLAGSSARCMWASPQPGGILMFKCMPWPLQCFGHLMRRVDSLEKTLMLEGIGGRRKRGWQRMRCLDGIGGLDGREFEWTPGVGDGQGGLVCCDSWSHKESDMTERLNWTELMAPPHGPTTLVLKHRFCHPVQCGRNQHLYRTLRCPVSVSSMLCNSNYYMPGLIGDWRAFQRSFWLYVILTLNLSPLTSIRGMTTEDSLPQAMFTVPFLQ